MSKQIIKSGDMLSIMVLKEYYLDKENVYNLSKNEKLLLMVILMNTTLYLKRFGYINRKILDKDLAINTRLKTEKTLIQKCIIDKKETKVLN